MEGAMAATGTRAASPQQYPHTPEDLRKEPNYPIWVRLRTGDRGARDELVVRYAPLVKYVIGRMAISLPAAMDSDDVLARPNARARSHPGRASQRARRRLAGARAYVARVGPRHRLARRLGFGR